jgi:hypothetical protein
MAYGACPDLTYVCAPCLPFACSLSLVYMEVAARVGLPMAGVNLPAHFMIRPQVGDGGTQLPVCADSMNRAVTDMECVTWPGIVFKTMAVPYQDTVIVAADCCCFPRLRAWSG